MDFIANISMGEYTETYEINNIDPKELMEHQLSILITAFFQNFSTGNFFGEENIDEDQMLKDQNRILQQRNTELVEENRKLVEEIKKLKLKLEEDEDCVQYMFRTEPRFK